MDRCVKLDSENVDFAWQDLTDDEIVKFIATTLPGSKVSTLNLEHNGVIGAEGASAIATALPGSKVTELILFDNNIGDEGASAIATALPRSEVSTLDLGVNNIGDKGARAIAAALPSSTVSTIYLVDRDHESEGPTRNKIGDEAKAELKAAAEAKGCELANWPLASREEERKKEARAERELYNGWNDAIEEKVKRLVLRDDGTQKSVDEMKAEYGAPVIKGLYREVITQVQAEGSSEEFISIQAFREHLWRIGGSDPQLNRLCASARL